MVKDTETLLQEANEFAEELKLRLVDSVIPADTSTTAKTPFKLRMIRELLLHRMSDLSNASCLYYNRGSIIPAFVLTRAAFETAAYLFYLNKSVEEAMAKPSVDDLDSLGMRGLFGVKDKSTPYEAVNVLTLVKHLDRTYQGLEDMFLFLCEFAHPNNPGVFGGYSSITTEHLDDPHVPVAIGTNASPLSPDYGLICLRIAISVAVHHADELAAHDEGVIQMCEQDL